MPLENNPKQIPDITLIATPTAGQETDIELPVAKHSTYATARMTLAQIFTLGSISGSIKVALDALSGLISGNTSSINTLSSTKLNIAGGTRTGLTANRALITDGSGVETYLTGTTTQVIGFDGSGQPIAVTPSVDVNGLTEKKTAVGTDMMILSDSDASFSNKKVKVGVMPLFLGDGADGPVTISTTVTLVRDMQYSSLTITSTGVLNTAGFRVLCTGTINIAASGVIKTDEANGGNASAGTGGVVGAITTSGTTLVAKQGIAGAAGQTSVNAPGNNPSYTDVTIYTSVLNANAAYGGNGGLVTSVAAGGVGTTGVVNFRGLVAGYQGIGGLLTGSMGIAGITSYRYVASNGGASGALSASSGHSGAGGAGGNNAGAIFMVASSIINAGIISSNGGTGGNASNANPGASNGQCGGGGGGGGGGCGGFIYLLTKTLTNTGTIRSNGGNGGNGSLGIALSSTSGVSGNGGNGGTGGFIMLPIGYAGTVTVSAGNGGTAGAAGANISAGVAGATGTTGVIVTY